VIVICFDFTPSDVDTTAFIEATVDSFETTGTDLLLIPGETTFGEGGEKKKKSSV
jgi:hypothetical protein